MPLTVTSVDALQKYLLGVLGRAGHHAKDVEDIALAIAGAVVWRKEGDLEVRRYAGRPANMLWFSTSQGRYALAYNHTKRVIELRARGKNGKVIETFNNLSPIASVKKAFAAI